MTFCMKCGRRLVATYEPAGFDHFWGWAVYRKRARCSEARWWNNHTDYTKRFPERADYYGFTDDTILAAAREER